MDPFQILPYNCQHKILRHLTGKCLLNMAEVSVAWRTLIEGDKYLMNRAMNGTVLKIKPDDKVIEDTFEKAVGSGILSRGFKQMTIENTNFIQPSTVLLYAHNLEYLKIESVFRANTSEISGCNFPNLKKLEIFVVRNDWIKWLLKCEFPLVEELSIEDKLFDQDVSNGIMLNILLKTPLLKKLRLSTKHGWHFHRFNQVPFNLEVLYLSRFDMRIIGKHVGTLKALKLEALKAAEFSFMLEECLNLEILLVKKILENDSDFIRLEVDYHQKIKTLGILEVNRDMLHILLAFFPNIETLILTQKNCQPNDVFALGKF